MKPLAPAELAARLDLTPTKQRGQNFVIDANTIRRIVALSGVSADTLAYFSKRPPQAKRDSDFALDPESVFDSDSAFVFAGPGEPSEC